MEDDDAGKADRQATLKQWVQAGVDDPESLDAATVYARARKAIDQAVKMPPRAERLAPGMRCLAIGALGAREDATNQQDLRREVEDDTPSANS
jgi:hypothetical protein